MEDKYSAKKIEECGFLKETELLNYSVPLMLEIGIMLLLV